MTSSLYALASCRVIFPGFPSPIVLSSTLTTGASSAAVPQTKTSSAVCTSNCVKNLYITGIFSLSASSMTVALVMPMRFETVGGVISTPLLTMKTLSAEASET